MDETQAHWSALYEAAMAGDYEAAEFLLMFGPWAASALVGALGRSRSETAGIADSD